MERQSCLLTLSQRSFDVSLTRDLIIFVNFVTLKYMLILLFLAPMWMGYESQSPCYYNSLWTHLWIIGCKTSVIHQLSCSNLDLHKTLNLLFSGNLLLLYYYFLTCFLCPGINLVTIFRNPLSSAQLNFYTHNFSYNACTYRKNTNLPSFVHSFLRNLSKDYLLHIILRTLKLLYYIDINILLPPQALI